MIRVELARGDTARALEHAREAAAIDTVGRTTAVLAHLEAEAGTESPGETPVARGQSTAFVMALEAPPSRGEVERLLDATLADLRRSLAGDASG
jgi:hypothetical protein